MVLQTRSCQHPSAIRNYWRVLLCSLNGVICSQSMIMVAMWSCQHIIHDYAELLTHAYYTQ